MMAAICCCRLALANCGRLKGLKSASSACSQVTHHLDEINRFMCKLQINDHDIRQTIPIHWYWISLTFVSALYWRVQIAAPTTISTMAICFKYMPLANGSITFTSSRFQPETPSRKAHVKWKETVRKLMPLFTKTHAEISWHDSTVLC